MLEFLKHKKTYWQSRCFWQRFTFYIQSAKIKHANFKQKNLKKVSKQIVDLKLLETEGSKILRVAYQFTSNR